MLVAGCREAQAVQEFVRKRATELSSREAFHAGGVVRVERHAEAVLAVGTAPMPKSGMHPIGVPWMRMSTRGMAMSGESVSAIRL